MKIIANEGECRSRVLGKPAKPDERPKKFVTFPYPYMNGNLHLGHAYTILNADMQARFHALNGYNVLFPFGFHGSGMPIVACAHKLRHELEKYEFDAKMHDDDFIGSLPATSQIKILLSMSVPIDSIRDFADPYHWIIYFSEHATQDLKQFGVSVDFSRSFYTTTINPSYDSFIRWQFTHLLKDGYVIRGKRYVIFSPLDQQPCADHDRSVGEGVKPQNVLTVKHKTEYGTFLVTVASENPTMFIFGDNFVKYTIDDETFISNELSYRNIFHQYDNVSKSEPITSDYFADWSDFNVDIKDNKNFGTGIYFVDVDQKINRVDSLPGSLKYEQFTYYEPESRVISRSGDMCVVAHTDQWFINYGHPELTEKVMEYIKMEFKTSDEACFNQFLAAVEWLNEWPCSRGYGLGTFIPGTTDLIDSLSDSTIYMAYYTVAHLLKTIPIEHMNQEFWDYIFLGVAYDIPIDYKETIDEMRREFLYWYPLDIRVSGKDLVSNHLTMALFNHYAIWKDFSKMPRKYLVNGHLLLNGEKMSKSSGVFLTMADAVKKYGTDPTRLTLANNDGITDGDFSESFANSAILKLAAENDWIIDWYDSKFELDEKPFTIWDILFSQEMSNICQTMYTAYETAKYRVIVHSFYKLIGARNEYIKMMNLCKIPLNHFLLNQYVQCICTTMVPVIPFFVEHIRTHISHPDYQFNSWPNIIVPPGDGDKYMYFKSLIDEVTNSCFRTITKKKVDVQFTIQIYKKFTDIEQSIIDDPAVVTAQSGKIFGQYKGFRTKIEKMLTVYPKWLSWLADDNSEEFEMLQKYVTLIIPSKCSFELIDPSDQSMFKYGPGMPRVLIITSTVTS